MANRGSTSFISIMYVVKSELTYVTLKPNFLCCRMKPNSNKSSRRHFSWCQKETKMFAIFLKVEGRSKAKKLFPKNYATFLSFI